MSAEAPAAEPPKNPEIDRLETEKRKAELEYEIAKQKQNLEKLGQPSPETKALEGKLTIDDRLHLPSQVLAYRAVGDILHRAGPEIAAAIERQGTKAVVIVTEKELGAVSAHGAAMSQIGSLRERYRQLVPLPVAAVAAEMLLAPALATTFLRSIADFTALFRTNVEIKSTTVTIEDVALVAELAREMAERRPPLTVLYPPLYLPKNFFVDPDSSSELMREVNGLLSDQSRGLQAMVAYEAKSPADQAKDPLRPKIPQLKALNDATDKLVSGLTRVDEKTGVSMLTDLLRGGLLRGRLRGPDVSLLLIKVNAAGGANQTKQGLFGRTQLLHAGGAVVTFMLLNSGGEIGYSRVFWASTDFVDFKDAVMVNFLRSQ